jgi:hypothetical protein
VTHLSNIVVTLCCFSSAGMAVVLHGTDALNGKGEIINARRIDSQAKHGVLARGGAELYVRLPKQGYVRIVSIDARFPVTKKL